MRMQREEVCIIYLAHITEDKKMSRASRHILPRPPNYQGTLPRHLRAGNGDMDADIFMILASIRISSSSAFAVEL